MNKSTLIAESVHPFLIETQITPLGEKSSDTHKNKKFVGHLQDEELYI